MSKNDRIRILVLPNLKCRFDLELDRDYIGRIVTEAWEFRKIPYSSLGTNTALEYREC